MKTLFKLAVVAALLALPVTAKAQLQWVIGEVRSVGEFIFGQTTVTPTYHLYTWDNVEKTSGGSLNDYSLSHKSYLFDQPTGVGFFSQVTVDWPFDPITNHDAFILSSPKIAHWNFVCDQQGGLSGNAAQTYTIMIMCTAVTSGMSPPAPPYNISFRTQGTGLATDCSRVLAPSRRFGKEFKVYPYGFVTGTIGVPSYEFAYPFQCWTGDPYLYN